LREVERDRERAQKRGGGAVVSLEFSCGEERYQREPAHEETPDRIFERRWALSVLGLPAWAFRCALRRAGP